MTYPEVLIFAGAGASAAFGVPVMREMTTRLEDRSKTSAFPEHLRPALSAVASRLREVYGEAYDLEKLLDTVAALAQGRTLLEDAREYPHLAFRLSELLARFGHERGPNLKAHDGQFSGGGQYPDLERAITAEVVRWCEGLDTVAAPVAWADLLVGLSTQKLAGRWGESVSPGHLFPGPRLPGILRATFVTTNYDLGIESSLGRLRIAPATGFVPDAASGANEFKLGARIEDAAGVPVLKLHGSIDWFRVHDGRVVHAPGRRVGDELLDGGRLERREIRYPIVTKSLGGLPYSALYTEFARALAAAKHWVFIGYSFGDESISSLVREIATPEKRLLVIGPHAGALAKARGLDGLKAQVESRDASFGKSDFGELYRPIPSNLL